MNNKSIILIKFVVNFSRHVWRLHVASLILFFGTIETAKAQFFLAIRSIIYKQTKGDAPDAETMNRVVEDMVRDAITCTGVENIVDENKQIDLFSEKFLDELKKVKMPITRLLPY